MERILLGFNLKMLEQETRIARVLRTNKIHLFQDLHTTKSHILQIPNRSGNQIEGAVARLPLKTLLNLHV